MVEHSARATLSVAVAASISYGSLVVTDFLGFKHFGVIGGIGMLLSWLATFLLLPPLILVTERRWPERTRPELVGFFRPGAIAAIPARLVTARPRTFAAGGILLALAGAAISVAFLEDPFEKDFRKLRSTATTEHGSAFWEAKSDAIFAQHMNPQVVLADRPEDVPEIVESLRAATQGERAPLEAVTALSSMVPDRQEEKLAVIRRIRTLLDERVPATLDERARSFALRFRSTETGELAAFTAKDLPESIRGDFRETDGTEGRVVLALPNLALDLYHADEIRRIAAVLRSIRLKDGRRVASSGNYVLYADMLDAVRTDGQKATGWSFAGVLVLCVLAFRRPRRAILVAGSLLVGMGWLGGLLALGGVRINFLNFIALPITFGIGADYAINVFSRGLFERAAHAPSEAARRSVEATGGAVALCSLTTVIGYGSLLVARNGALISFGRVAILGELTCLGAALLVLPAWMSLVKDRADLRA
jgi:predicted RND superfamily exporter protein